MPLKDVIENYYNQLESEETYLGRDKFEKECDAALELMRQDVRDYEFSSLHLILSPGIKNINKAAPYKIKFEYNIRKFEYLPIVSGKIEFNLINTQIYQHISPAGKKWHLSRLDGFRHIHDTICGALVEKLDYNLTLI